MQTILVCDDDKQIVEAIDIYLTGEGFQVIKAYDGYEALEYLEGNQVDLLIVDVMMPGLDGIRTTLKVRENSSIPIIILSAKSEDADPFEHHHAQTCKAGTQHKTDCPQRHAEQNAHGNAEQGNCFSSLCRSR